MALNPAQLLYRDEFVASFEQRQSYLRDTVTTEAMVKGTSATFLVTAQAEAMKQRGVDGLIPASNEVDAQVTIPLLEMHHRTTVTSWDIFQGQGDRRAIMQYRGMVAANKEIDDSITTALTAATNTWSQVINATNYPTGLTVGKFADIMQYLYANQIDNDGGITCVWTPKMYAAIMAVSQVTSMDWVDKKPLIDGPQPFQWLGARHIMHPRLPGTGTATASCFIYHKNAVGHAVDIADIRTEIGYNGEHDYSFARHSISHGSKILQNAGVLKITSDDTRVLP